MTELVFASAHRSIQGTEAVATPAAEDRRTVSLAGGVWGEFLRKVLPPVPPEPALRMIHAARA